MAKETPTFEPPETGNPCPELHIRWIDRAEDDLRDFYGSFLSVAREAFAPFPVPEHESMILLRAEVAELPGLSVYTTEPYVLRTWEDNPFGAWMNAPDPAPPRPGPEIEVHHEVRLRTTKIDERWPFATICGLHRLVEKRAAEVYAERIGRREAHDG